MPVQPQASDWVDGSGSRYPADLSGSEAAATVTLVDS